MPLCALLLDFNSYFASVEQQLRPDLRGKPLGILPVVAETTCCIAASREAKQFGVKTGTSVADARRLCPNIVFVEARPAVYIEMHHRLMAIVDSVIAVSEVLSIDEVACDLTGSWRQEEVIRARCLAVKARLREQAGECLTCSIGIGPNRFLAKTASNMQKPDGLTVIHQADLPDILYHLQLGDLNGIGRAMLERLNRHGIYTVAALFQASREQLRRVWGGVEGERFYDRLRGVATPQSAPSRRASIGHSHVLPPHLRHLAGAGSVLSKLTQKAALRLRAEGYLAGRLSLCVAWRRDDAWEVAATFSPLSDTLSLLRILNGLWAERPSHGEPVKVGMTLSDLHPAEQETLPLFAYGAGHPGLDTAFDQIRRKYGNDALYFGGAYQAAHEASMRIAFSHIPDLVLESDGREHG
ncbi:MAG: DNA polymerase [Hydrogenophilaceae bacterium CG1_02_62_390]|nr:DNA polymerase [Betaproteobacteria bacterium]OIO79971.1 MAG: DNA polymerase [Hydrogenophilaceae bacterium CG1_02_62_390]PIW39501.1 MAG: DNA polymerase [Hydrogenophilales bacterium CG15_BIG_FIL_POST_REV_8_21_14_020_62_31]